MEDHVRFYLHLHHDDCIGGLTGGGIDIVVPRGLCRPTGLHVTFCLVLFKHSSGFTTSSPGVRQQTNAEQRSH